MVKYTNKKTYKAKRGKKITRKVQKKKYSAHKNLVSLIKKVSLKQSETKYSHISVENTNINHNAGYIITGLLNTTQGITDQGTGTSFNAARIGDEVIARGISLKFWIANKLDRPNVMYRIFVFKYQANSIPVSSSLFKGAVSNRIMDDLDKEVITVVYQKIFNLQVGFSAYPTGTAGDQDGREAHKYLQMWIPLKDKRIHYPDGGAVPKFFNYGFFIVPYDSYGTLITDNIASFAYEHKFYFKDP